MSAFPYLPYMLVFALVILLAVAALAWRDDDRASGPKRPRWWRRRGGSDYDY